MLKLPKRFVLLMLLSSLSQADTNSWLQTHLLNPEAKPPFSFLYGNQGSEALLKNWPRKLESRALDSNRTQSTLIWSDPESGLQVRIVAVEFANSTVVEWVGYFTNTGKVSTPILEYVSALSTAIDVPGKGVPTVLYSRGTGGMDTYSLQKRTLNQLESFSISNESGGKTIDTIPFFDILMEGEGLIGAVGWPGCWQISFTRSAESSISVSAGM